MINEARLKIYEFRYANEEAEKSHIASTHFQAFHKQFLEQMQGLLAEPLDVKIGSFAAGFENQNIV